MRCTAKSKRSGERCKSYAVAGGTKCRIHGGASLAGVASATFKTGRYSKHIPTRLAARYGEALADPKLLELRDEIALVGTRQSELLERLDAGLSLQHWKDAQTAHSEMLAAIRAKDSVTMQTALVALGDALNVGMGDYAVWQEIIEMTEQRRRLVDSEHKRLVAMQQMITAEQAMVLLARVTDAIRKHVSDPTAVAAISAQLRTIVTAEAS